MSLDGEASQSPSLRTWMPGQLPAHEMKFLLSEGQARDVETQLQPRLSLDPHANSELGNAYLTTTLYCDTPRLEVFHQRGEYRRRKYRVRRYGDADWVFLERKAKRGTQVRKRRTTVINSELNQLNHPMSAVDWTGHWFHRQLTRRELHPTLLVKYFRTAYFGTCDEGPLRLTFDRSIHGISTHDWNVVPFDHGQPILFGQVVCEFKFQGSLPVLFKRVIQELQLSPTGVSKYRHCMMTCQPQTNHALNDTPATAISSLSKHIE